eukprot:2664608-Pleurochrysis_carterae.AAC.1
MRCRGIAPQRAQDCGSNAQLWKPLDRKLTIREREDKRRARWTKFEIAASRIGFWRQNSGCTRVGALAPVARGCCAEKKAASHTTGALDSLLLILEYPFFKFRQCSIIHFDLPIFFCREPSVFERSFAPSVFARFFAGQQRVEKSASQIAVTPPTPQRVSVKQRLPRRSALQPRCLPAHESAPRWSDPHP